MNQSSIRLEAEAGISTMFGHFRIHGYSRGDEQSVALLRGNITGRRNVLARIQSSCLFGESFHATDCDCSWQVTTSLRKIAQEKCGIFIYLFQEGRGIGLFEKIRAFRIQQEDSVDTVEAFERLGFERTDLRSYAIAADIIKFEGIHSVRLLTNNLDKIDALKHTGIPAVREPLELEEADFKKLTAHMTDDDIRDLIDYLETKREKLGHQFMDASLRRILQSLNSRATEENP